MGDPYGGNADFNPFGTPPDQVPGNYDPNAPKVSDNAWMFAPAVVNTIIRNSGRTLTAEQRAALTNGVVSQLQAGLLPSQIISGTSTTADIDKAIGSGQTDPKYTGLAGRLGTTDLPTGLTGGGDPSTWKTDANGWFLLPNGNRMDPSSGKIFDANGNLVTGAAGGGSSRTASQEAADAASANANNAQAAKIYADMQRQNDLDMAIKNGALYATNDPDVFYTANGSIYNAGEIKISQARLAEEARHNQAGEQIDQGRLGVETTRAANEASYQQGQLGIGQEGNRLRGIEIGNSAAYQRGQLQQGTQRLALDTAVAGSAAAAKTQENDLARQQYISKILANPSDFIARAFQQRGETSPQTRVTQADLINTINSQFNSNPTAFVAPQNLAGPTVNPQNVPQYAYGSDTMVRDRLAVVGDPQADGKPNPEVIHNPTGAPISVTPVKNAGMTDSPGNRLTPEEDPRVKQEQARADAIAKVLQHVESPDTLHRLVDELTEKRNRLGNTTVKAYAEGTDSGGTVASIGWTPGVGYTVGSGNSLTGASATAAGNSGFSNNTASSTTVTANPNYRPGPISSVPNTPATDMTLNYNDNFKTILDQMLEALKPKTPTLPTVSQGELEATADRNLPPAARALFNTSGRLGQAEVAKNPVNNRLIQPNSYGFNLFSPQSLAQLSPDEKLALNSYLGVKYNTTLEDVMHSMKDLYTTDNVGGGRLVVR